MNRLPAVLLTMFAVTGCASVVPGVVAVADTSWVPEGMTSAPGGKVAYRWPDEAEQFCLGQGGCYSVWVAVPQRCRGMEVRFSITSKDGTRSTLDYFSPGVFNTDAETRIQVPADGGRVGDKADVLSMSCGPL